MEIAKMLVLSTAHLTEDTCNRYLPDHLHAYAKADYGFFLNVPTERPDFDAGYPADLVHVLAFAAGAGCDWVMFDQDGPDIAALPVYDWDTVAA